MGAGIIKGDVENVKDVGDVKDVARIFNPRLLTGIVFREWGRVGALRRLGVKE